MKLTCSVILKNHTYYHFDDKFFRNSRIYSMVHECLHGIHIAFTKNIPVIVHRVLFRNGYIHIVQNS